MMQYFLTQKQNHQKTKEENNDKSTYSVDNTEGCDDTVQYTQYDYDNEVVEETVEDVDYHESESEIEFAGELESESESESSCESDSDSDSDSEYCNCRADRSGPRMLMNMTSLSSIIEVGEHSWLLSIDNKPLFSSKSFGMIRKFMKSYAATVFHKLSRTHQCRIRDKGVSMYIEGECRWAILSYTKTFHSLRIDKIWGDPEM